MATRIYYHSNDLDAIREAVDECVSERDCVSLKWACAESSMNGVHLDYDVYFDTYEEADETAKARYNDPAGCAGRAFPVAVVATSTDTEAGYILPPFTKGPARRCKTVTARRKEAEAKAREVLDEETLRDLGIEP